MRLRARLKDQKKSKLRALAERRRPRDIYGVIHLYEAKKNLKSKRLLLDILKEKCQFKNISLPQTQSIYVRLNTIVISSEWNQMLAHQIPRLASFEEYLTLISVIFDWLYNMTN